VFGLKRKILFIHIYIFIRMTLKISINCVAKNESLFLDTCLESIIPYVDEILFMDHGSIDDTKVVAEKLCQRYANFKMMYSLENSDLANAREYLRLNSSNKIIFWYDADFFTTDINKITEYVRILETDKDMTSVSFRVRNFQYDLHHYSKKTNVYHHKYIFKRDAYHFINDQHCDQLVPFNHHHTLYSDAFPLLHLNNVKPIFNLYFRHHMGPYYTSGSDMNYFDWVFHKHFRRKAESSAELTDFIMAGMRYILRREMTPTTADTVGEVDFAIPYALKNNFYNDKFRVIPKADGRLFIDKYIVIQYKEHILLYQEGTDVKLFEQKLNDILTQMYLDGAFDKF
jgi:glycosyltransferase involved in cell wall biosynthesis